METKKLLAIGIIFLFIGVAIAPSINAHTDIMFPKADSNLKKEISITVLECKANGDIGKSVVKMSQEKAEKLKGELTGAKDSATRLSIYKKYDLIPQNVTDEKLRLGMEEKARRLGPEIKMLQNFIAYPKNKMPTHFGINFMCQMDFILFCGLKFLGGLSLITGAINTFLLLRDLEPILSIDLFQIHIGLLGAMDLYNGALPASGISGWLIASLLLGFVGYYISSLPFIFLTTISFCYGYTVASIGFVFTIFEP